MEQTEFEKKYKGKENVKNIDEFASLLKQATADADDYGSIVMCCALMMNAAFHLVDNGPSGGITGFQASCLMWEMVKKYGMYSDNVPLRLIDYSDLLYPQNEHKFNSLPKETWEWAVKEAKEKLQKEDVNTWHPSVFYHIKDIAEGQVPFGLKVVE